MSSKISQQKDVYQLVNFSIVVCYVEKSSLKIFCALPKNKNRKADYSEHLHLIIR